MKDNEIIHALEWCDQFENNIVFNGNGDEKCVQALQVMVVIKHYLKAYNRQQAEIERLKDIARDALNESIKLCDSILEVKAKSISEFAEKLKENAHFISGNEEHTDIDAVYIEDIDETLKEMVGD